MSKPRRIKRPISGVVLLDKPKGFSSNQTLQKVRWLYQAALCRDPSAAELAAARDSLGTQVTAESIADALWAVLMLPEFLSVR